MYRGSEPAGSHRCIEPARESAPPPDSGSQGSGASRREKAVLWLCVVVRLAAPLVAIVFAWQRCVNARDIALLIGLYLACGLGITIGFHRMLTHRSFTPRPVVKLAFLALGAMAAMGPPCIWAMTHIKHHACADDDGDPHSPWDWVDRARRIRRTGFKQFNRAHFLWAIYGEPVPEDGPGHWLRDDPMVRWLSRWDIYTALVALGFVVPFLIDGWQGLIWGGVVRIGLTHHITWSINSVCHVYGRRMFDTPDCSRNNWLFGLLGLGEGWHNNHHAFPRSAFHGLRWWQVDPSGYLIRAMEWFGLVRNVWRVPEDRLRARLIRPDLRPRAHERG